MTTTSLLSKEHVLGEKYRGFDVSPLGKIYYSQFPFRVTLRYVPDPDAKVQYTKFMNDFLNEDFAVSDLNMQEIDRLVVVSRLNRAERVILKALGDTPKRKSKSAGQVWDDNYETVTFRGELRLFLPTVQAVDTVLDYANGKNVVDVEAIQTQDQLELMQDPRFTTQGRKAKFFNEYDYKVEIKMDENMGHGDVRDAYKVIRDFLRTQASPDEYAIRKAWKKMSVFGNQDLIMGVMPMLRFELKMDAFTITRAIVSSD